MKWIFSLLINSLGKQLGVFLFGWIKNLHYIRKGSMKERKRQEQANQKAKEQADEIRKDVDATNIADIREWLRQHKNK